ncbi:MAG: hypothetical protein IKR05_14230, partial [Prevotella sp.]|nr:hypothetical protein [Prevotella sp.]
PKSPTTSFGLTDRKNTFEGGKTPPKRFGVRGIVFQNEQYCKMLLLFGILRLPTCFICQNLRLKNIVADFGNTSSFRTG